jgi:type IV secretory pathway ATPase VirB11/archaellum biosynthesis ATPase
MESWNVVKTPVTVRTAAAASGAADVVSAAQAPHPCRSYSSGRRATSKHLVGHLLRTHAPAYTPQIVTGFLGSGKTTFINTILNDSSHKLKIAVIENEFGEARSLRAWVAAVTQQSARLTCRTYTRTPHRLRRTTDWHRRRAAFRADGGERCGDEQWLHLLHRAR